MTANTTQETTTFVDVWGKKTQVSRGGEGPPLVYLHGAVGDTEWTPFHRALARHYTVYAPAHPGFALSEGLDQVDDISDLAWHYVDLFEQLELSCVPVVGFSLGGWLAAELAILRPEVVGSLVLLAAAGLHVDGAPIAEWFVAEPDELQEQVFHDPSTAIARQLLPCGPEDPRLLMWHRAREATARVAWNPYFHNPALSKHLRRLACPTQLIWGCQDRIIPPVHGARFAQLISGATLELLDQCGHMVPHERPEVCARKIYDFVESPSVFTSYEAMAESTARLKAA